MHHNASAQWECTAGLLCAAVSDTVLQAKLQGKEVLSQKLRLLLCVAKIDNDSALCFRSCRSTHSLALVIGDQRGDQRDGQEHVGTHESQAY